MNRRQNTSRIVLVEDNLGDVVLFREALAEADNAVDLHVCQSLEQVEASIPELENAFKHTGIVILMDINLLRCSGFDIIPIFRSNQILQHIPIVMFTSSHAPNDIVRSYQLGANAFVSKPDDLAGYRSFAKCLIDFWMKQAITTSSVNASL